MYFTFSQTYSKSPHLIPSKRVPLSFSSSCIAQLINLLKLAYITSMLQNT